MNNEQKLQVATDALARIADNDSADHAQWRIAHQALAVIFAPSTEQQAATTSDAVAGIIREIRAAKTLAMRDSLFEKLVTELEGTERAATQPAGEVGNLLTLLSEQKDDVKQRDGDWWRGYEAALHWISKSITEKGN